MSAAVAEADAPGAAEADEVVADERFPTRLPAWFDAGLVVVAAALVGCGGVGLLLAVVGHYRLLTTLLVGGALAVVLAVGALRRRPLTDAGPVTVWPSVVACLVALASAAYNGLRAGHYVFVDRDPGVYTVTGRWIAAHGDLSVPMTAPGLVVPGLTNSGSAGMYPEGNHLEFQFDHLFPTLLAIARGIGGDRAMFSANAVIGAIGLLAVYAVGVRLCRNPWLVVTAVAALALSLPELLFSRDTYSEPTAQALLWCGLWLLLSAWDRRDLWRAGFGGLLVGATAMARIDALAYLLALPVVVGLIVVAARSRADRRFRIGFGLAGLVAAVPPVVLGFVDLTVRATGYNAALAAQIGPLRKVLIAAVVVGLVIAVVVPWLPWLTRWVARWRARFGAGAAVAVIVVLVVAWAVRPALQHPTYVVNTTVGALQAHEGLPVAPTLTYAEDSLTWFSWYLGTPVLVLAILGLGVMTRRAIAGAPAALALTTAIGPATLLYLYRASNTPEQVWVMRRYLPAVMPLFVLAAVVAVEAVVAVIRTTSVPPVVGRIATAVAGVALVAFPLGALVPVRSFETQADFLPAVDKACATFGSDATVAFAFQDLDSIVLPQTVRSFCGVPATRLHVVPTAAQITALEATVRASGRTLWIVGTTEDAVRKAVGDAGTPVLVSQAVNPHKLETTLTRLPDSLTTETLTIWAARVG